MSHKTWFSIRAAAANAPAYISIYDEIGLGGVTAGQFEAALRGLGEPRAIELHINSPGGDVFQATAIHSMLDRHPARVTAYVDGVAASAASLIAMAGDDIIMPANAMMMVHAPSGAVLGTGDDIRDMADTLDRIGQAMASTYARRTGQPIDRVIAWMDAETWFTAAEAVQYGFATVVEQPVKIAASWDATGRWRWTPPNLAPQSMGDLAADYWAKRASPATQAAQVRAGKPPRAFNQTAAEAVWAGIRAREAGDGQA
jgi:ATP-dependent protease ClpP protease subunit